MQTNEIAMQTDANAQRDLDTLTALNRDFVASVQKGDVKRLDEIFADDFMVSTPDGSLLDKAEYLKLVAQPVTIRGLVAEDVQIRLLGDFAIIHARFNSRFADGKQRRGRYTDNYARRDGTWVAVSAHYHLDHRDG
jgi:ketosteroid isomerase-like protein